MAPVPSWPPHSSRVVYFRDPFGTYYAAEVWHTAEWHDELREPPPLAVADVRLLLTVRDARLPSDLPPWVAIASSDPDTPEAASAVARAWPRSPHFRPPGDQPEEYVVAGFQALCPPHPACEAGPHARESLIAFLRDRPGLLGAIAEEGRDGFDRRLRIHWQTAGAFASAILRERLRDAGAHRALAVGDAVDRAEIAGEVGEYADLGQERELLRVRLDPVGCFLHAVDFDRAVDDGEVWIARYTQALDAFAMRLRAEAQDVLREIAAAVSGLDVLVRLNHEGRPLAVDAAQRLMVAAAEVQALVSDSQPDGLVPGRAPLCLSEARLTSAAVLAALEVQRRRTQHGRSAADHSA
ncbi:MAG: hypothetical protein O2798_04060 [Chloroflexi bacterium]|nr:hypothetical protein [Chloroflexota bacterium]MDA1239999.1 hypothetical protein [Chloroflexota bacterium]